MLKVYTDHNFLNKDNRREIFPLLFDIVYLPNDKTKQNFDLTNSLLEADVAIFPVDIISFLKKDKTDFLNKWIEKVSKFDIPIWVYAGGDFGFTFEHTKVTTFRLGGFDSKLSVRSEIMPSFVSDPYKEVLKSDFFTISKETKPHIGFVGNANGTFTKWVKEFLLYFKRNIIDIKNPEDYHPFYPASKKRFSLLRKIQKDEKIQDNFIFRNKYRARDLNIEKTTMEFFKNIQESLYVFCLRGNGNFSVRFYEALIMGRIPVLIDTNARLPLEDLIDWKKHCLIVSENSIIEDLLRFHSSKTEAELKEMQENNRNLVFEKLNRIDYFIQMANIHLKKK
ncbi:glycosyltransferase family 47 protein [Flavobacterium sp. 17A]|uniref:Glycosyltransferase family 47 protein n=1 Tax=Flavobacterium potami TaxID=2872310 RepID=A0A9X1HC08_9FLAO|nr:exostosin family protein [Flavobacterium potami]MBZ4036584.1 glycosyltransferase family 47 protein [Flavobacterium potami]